MVLGGSHGGGRFLMGEVPLQRFSAFRVVSSHGDPVPLSRKLGTNKTVKFRFRL